MRVDEACAACLMRKQQGIAKGNKNYLAEIREILDGRRESDTAPHLLLKFDAVYERYFGKVPSMREIRKTYNDLAISMEGALKERIEAAEDPLAEALLYARIGNYIDFGAMDHVDREEFVSLFEGAKLSEADLRTYEKFVRRCGEAERFLLIADNCGEIVLDRLFLEQLKNRFPQLRMDVMVRGGEVLNDATVEDAEYAGIGEVAGIVSNGAAAAGTVIDMLPENALEVLKAADVIVAKGQGNYESLSGQGYPVFYSFLCKCEHFTEKFGVPLLTGMFVEE